jgi:bifunctional non-homologous end joining protein LigD
MSDGGVCLPKMFKYCLVSDSRVLDLILSPAYCMQQKMDGRRLVVAKSSQGVSCYNKRLEPATAPKWLLEAVAILPEGSWTFDGELMANGDYHIFDVPKTPSTSPVMPFDERQMMLGVVMKSWRHPQIHRVDTWFDPEEKFMQLLRLRRAGAEGVVFRPRETNAHFNAQLYKYKFYQTVDAIVMEKRVDGKEAISVAVHHKGCLKGIGKAKVDFQTQDAMGTMDTVVEIRHRGLGKHIEDGGKMIEPVFMRIRTDKPAYSCSSDQLTMVGQSRETYASHYISDSDIEDCLGVDQHKAMQLIKGERNE